VEGLFVSAFTPPYHARIMLRVRGTADEPTELVRFKRIMYASDWEHWTRDLSDCWDVWVEKPMDAKQRLETFAARSATRQRH
jgi:uncharacterized protein YaeQ